MIRLVNLLKEIKVVNPKTELIFWPALLKALRRNFGKDWKIYNNLATSSPSVKIYSATNNLEDIKQFIDSIDGWRSSPISRGWQGKTQLLIYPTTMARGKVNQDLLSSYRHPEREISPLVLDFFTKLRQQGIADLNTPQEYFSFIKPHFPAGVNEIKVEPGGPVILKIFNYDPSSYKLIDIEIEPHISEKEAKKAAVAHNWEIAWENGDTDLSKEEYLSTYSWEDLNDISYDNYGYEIEQK
jgi:hypothetical protein